ncbi:hypothetical protein B5M44_17345 [Shinella sumterensis]|nr:hypothetical protein [Shinella sumterensis]TFE96974.1 hypothetical protein B5M44_17345 [Shinella sumterensis]
MVDPEPLHTDHPLWRHAPVVITPACRCTAPTRGRRDWPSAGVERLPPITAIRSPRACARSRSFATYRRSRAAW